MNFNCSKMENFNPVFSEFSFSEIYETLPARIQRNLRKRTISQGIFNHRVTFYNKLNKKHKMRLSEIESIKDILISEGIKCEIVDKILIRKN